MIARHFKPMVPELRAIRLTQLNDFVVNEVAICSFIRVFRELGYYFSHKAVPSVLLALKRFEEAHTESSLNRHCP